ncbi:uncharacterized protein [Dysidea avara]|uniref:uncharacterized protein n=1 Tax=Dysidea avara TaxID=196820 RepID=UPI00331C2DAD
MGNFLGKIGEKGLVKGSENLSVAVVKGSENVSTSLENGSFYIERGLESGIAKGSYRLTVGLIIGFGALGLCFIAGVWGGVTIYYREQKKFRALRSASKEADGQKNVSNPVEDSNTVEDFTQSRKGICFQSGNSENQASTYSASAPSEMEQRVWAGHGKGNLLNGMWAGHGKEHPLNS